MPIFFAMIGTPLACFSEGALLAATVYITSRGAKRQLPSKKK